MLNRASLVWNRRERIVEAGTAPGTLSPVKSATTSPSDHKRFLSNIVDAYDSSIIRAYCKVRFTIININILEILGHCLRGKRKILDVGCGFGLFGCYFAAKDPEISYTGIDLNANRIETARRSATRLGLNNAAFYRGDARDLSIDDEYDAVLMVDLLHHVDDKAKSRLMETCFSHLARDGRLVIKDITTHPFHKIAFTWALDVLVTGSVDMWYRDEKSFYEMLGRHFENIERHEITDWLPYPHVIFVCEKKAHAADPVFSRSFKNKSLYIH